MYGGGAGAGSNTSSVGEGLPWSGGRSGSDCMTHKRKDGVTDVD